MLVSGLTQCQWQVPRVLMGLSDKQYPSMHREPGRVGSRQAALATVGVAQPWPLDFCSSRTSERLGGFVSLARVT